MIVKGSGGKKVNLFSTKMLLLLFQNLQKKILVTSTSTNLLLENYGIFLKAALELFHFQGKNIEQSLSIRKQISLDFTQVFM